MISESADEHIRRLISWHERGYLSNNEMVHKIADCALDPEFFNHLHFIPADVISKLREIAKDAPAHPEDFFLINAGSGSCDSFELAREHDRESRVRVYWSARRLREYFFPDQPLPEFEPLKLAGLVEESIEWNGAVVVFGDFRCLIRQNPVHLIAPDGTKLIESSAAEGFFKRSVDEESEDAVTRRYGQLGVRLDHVKTPADVPRGTEVWVDRTTVAELPDPPDR